LSIQAAADSVSFYSRIGITGLWEAILGFRNQLKELGFEQLKCDNEAAVIMIKSVLCTSQAGDLSVESCPGEAMVSTIC
jgi:hypothetical protein